LKAAATQRKEVSALKNRQDMLARKKEKAKEQETAQAEEAERLQQVKDEEEEERLEAIEAEKQIMRGAKKNISALHGGEERPVLQNLHERVLGSSRAALPPVRPLLLRALHRLDDRPCSQQAASSQMLGVRSRDRRTGGGGYAKELLYHLGAVEIYYVKLVGEALSHPEKEEQLQLR